MRFLFYLMPGLVDMIIGVFFFVSAKRMANSGANSFMIGLTMTVWAVFYAVTSYLLGLIQNRRNAVKLLYASLCILYLSLLGLMLFSNLHLQYLFLVGTGIGCAMFFCPFQIVSGLFGKTVYDLESIAKNTGLYTFSWSLGMAMGPFASGFVWGLFNEANGWRYCYGITILLLTIVLFCNMVLARFVKRRMTELGASPEQPGDIKIEVPEAQKQLPDLMLAAWIFQAIGYIVIAMMRTYLPDYCTKELAMSTTHQGIVIAMISFAQAGTGFVCQWARRWPYRAWVPASVSLLACISFTVFTLTGNWCYYAGAALFLGVFSGVFCFLATFHGLMNPTKSARYVGINEMIVGLGSMFAPLLGGALVLGGRPRLPFLFCIFALLVAAASYAIVVFRTKARQS